MQTFTLIPNISAKNNVALKLFSLPIWPKHPQFCHNFSHDVNILSKKIDIVLNCIINIFNFKTYNHPFTSHNLSNFSKIFAFKYIPTYQSINLLLQLYVSFILMAFLMLLNLLLQLYLSFIVMAFLIFLNLLLQLYQFSSSAIGHSYVWQ